MKSSKAETGGPRVDDVSRGPLIVVRDSAAERFGGLAFLGRGLGLPGKHRVVAPAS
jgi:hypothetical protein